MLRAMATKHRPPVATRTWPTKCGSQGGLVTELCVDVPWWGVLSLRVRPNYCHVHCATGMDKCRAQPQEDREGSHCSPDSWAAHHDCSDWLYHQCSWDPCAFFMSRLWWVWGSTPPANTREPATGFWMLAEDRRFLGQRQRTSLFMA